MKAQYEYLVGKSKVLVMIKTNDYNLAVSVISKSNKEVGKQ
jgi:hypothetical protein